MSVSRKKLGGHRIAGATEPVRDQPHQPGMRAERFGHHIGAAGPQPVLKQALRQQVRRDDDAAAPRRRSAATASATRGVPVAANASSTREPVIADSHVAIMCRSRWAPGSDVPAAARITESSRRQPDSTSRSANTRTSCGPGPERFRHGDIGMSACLDVRGYIGGDVIAAGQERRHHDRRPGHLTPGPRTASAPARRRTTRAPSARASQTPAPPDHRPSRHPAACGCRAPPTPRLIVRAPSLRRPPAGNRA